MLGIGVNALILITFSVIILYAFYKWITKYYNYFEKQNIPHLKPTFIVGNTGSLMLRKLTVNKFISNLYNSFPSERIFGFFDSRIPYFLLRDAELIKQLAVKDFDYFEDHSLIIDAEVDRYFGNSLIFLRGQKWRDMRATLSPVFTGSKMRQMYELIANCSKETVKYFITKTKENPSDGNNQLDIETKDLFARYTIDVIASCAFGIETNSFYKQNNEFYKIGMKLMNSLKNIKSLVKLCFFKMFPKLMKFIDIEFLDKKIGTFFRTMVLNNMEIRERQQINRPDLINTLMKIRQRNNDNNTNNLLEDLEDSTATAATSDDSSGFSIVNESAIGKSMVNRKWTDDELIAQCCIFFMAGFDSTSTILTFMQYELARHIDIQNKLYQEIKEFSEKLNGQQLQYDDLKYLKYLDMTISETLRLWPAAVVTDRQCTKDYEYDIPNDSLKFKIRKGSSIWIPIYALHHDRKYFPNPEKFDPERFNDENRMNINLGIYLPFGIGPRNCIGSRFALMTIKSIMYHLILNFEIHINQNTEIPIEISKSPFSLTPARGLYLTLKCRNSL